MTRPRLTPAIADVRRAVRVALARVADADAATADAARADAAAAVNAATTDSLHTLRIGNSGVGLSQQPFEPVLPSPAAPFPEFPKVASHNPDSTDDPKVASRNPESADDPREASHNPASPDDPNAANRNQGGSRGLVLVALSGGPDSLALAAATAFEAPRLGLRAGAVIVDHDLQVGSADVASAASAAAEALGLNPILVRKVAVGGQGGPEATARTARYRALDDARATTGASHVLLGHTLDDQAETVLLGLARGSGASSLQGMDAAAGAYLRPLLGIRRLTTVQFCVDARLDAWRDPQNDDPAFARVRVRRNLLPILENELGPGIAEALARTAEQLREDAEALDKFAEEMIEDLAGHAEAGISLPVLSLASNPAALRQRLIRLVVHGEFSVSLSRAHTLEVARLVTDWHGQGALDLPGIRVERQGGLIVFSASGPNQIDG